MKRKLLYSCLAASLLVGSAVNAQLVGDQIFMQGHWLEVGVAPNGSWGNTMPVPAGYHSHSGSSIGGYPDPITGTAATGNGIDFSFDVGHDGWTTGSPLPGSACCFYGAYFLPGTPFDGWSIQMNGVRSDAFYTSGPAGGFATSGGATFSGTNVGYNYTPSSPCGPYMESTMAGEWVGSYTAGGGTVSIRTTNRVDTNAAWDLVNVTFKNTGASPISDLYYFVTADPDNDEVIPGSFPTNNHIVYQGGPENKHEVTARPPSAHQDAFSGLATKDCRAKVLIYVSWPPPLVAGNALDLIYAETATSIGTSHYELGATTLSQDIAYGLIFKLGDLAPGDSTRLSFAWIFSDTAAIDSAFPQPQLNVNCSLVPDIDTFIPCGYSTIPVNIVHGEWGTTNWVWSPATGLASTTGITNSIDPSALSGEITYTITGSDTASCNHFQFLLTLPACFYASSNSPADSPSAEWLCIDDTLRLYANGDSLGATYLWYGPYPAATVRGYTQYVKIPHVTWADTGWYYVVKTLAGVNDTETTHVMFKPKPPITATYNAPLCSGSTLMLYSNPDSVGETWSWIGPDGYTSVLSDPTRPGAPTTYSGDYKVIATLANGCTDSSVVTVVIDSTPEVPTVTSNSFVCEEDTLLLFATCATPGVTYSWDGPSGFTSTEQNPTIPNVPLTAAGTYTVTVRRGLCTNSGTTVVDVRLKPNPVLGSNGPVCSGTSLNLTTTAPPGGPTFAWTGPIGFTSGVQNPSLSPAITANTGTYSVVVTLNGCSSDTVSIYAVVDSTPEMPTVSTNSPGTPGPTLCQEDTLTLSAFSGTAGASYSWTGPNSFSSTDANPDINPALPASSGVYTVVVSLGSCSVTAYVTATVTPTPPISATSNSPVCSGGADTLKLAATSDPGASFTWTGPYTFFSSAQSPFRTPVSTEYAGVYHVSVLLNGCTNSTTHEVIVNPTPTPPWVKWLTYCQYYDAPYLQAGGDNLLWYTSSDPTEVGVPDAPKPATDAVGVSFYYVNQTVMGCASARDSIRVRIDPTPTVTVRADTTVCPRDSVRLWAVNPDAVAYYHWSPWQYLYLPDTASSQVTAWPETDIEYMVVSSNEFGCSDSARVMVRVKAGAVMNVRDSVTLFPGESYHIQPMTNCSKFYWVPAVGLDSRFASDPVAAPEVSTKYVVTAETEWGCKTQDSINVNVNTESLLQVPNAFAPGSGTNNVFRIVKRGQANLRYFRVFDRWGVLIFQTNNIEEGWDGTYKGVLQPMGVYVYDISAVTSTGKVFNKTGNVTLLQ